MNRYILAERKEPENRFLAPASFENRVKIAKRLSGEYPGSVFQDQKSFAYLWLASRGPAAGFPFGIGRCVLTNPDASEVWLWWVVLPVTGFAPQVFRKLIIAPKQKDEMMELVDHRSTAFLNPEELVLEDMRAHLDKARFQAPYKYRKEHLAGVPAKSKFVVVSETPLRDGTVPRVEFLVTNMLVTFVSLKFLKLKEANELYPAYAWNKL